jgi:quercetin dioxygenase-like cupin family protein
MMLDDVTMDWFMEDSIDCRAGISLAKMTVAVGVTSELHHHTNCTETIHVLKGPIEQRIGQNWIALKTGETCVIPVNQTHQTRNVGDCRAVLMIAYSAGSRVYVTGEI